MAAWIAGRQFEMTPGADLPQFPFQIPQHSDLHWIQPEEDKHTIGVDQVRNLVGELVLTSFAGGGKIAVIEPANAMTANAANGLLKTLEEPRGDTLLILVADKVGYLPATIFSRCQRINFNRPDTVQSLRWLDQLKPDSQWAQALQAAGGSPLGAIQARDRLDDTEAMTRDFIAVGGQQESPISVAARWAKHDPGFVLDWLCGQIHLVIQRVSEGGGATSLAAKGDSVLHHIDRRNLFCYLDLINRLRGQNVGSFNVQLTLEGLLIDWAEGLRTVQRPGNIENAKLTFLNR